MEEQRTERRHDMEEERTERRHGIVRKTEEKGWREESKKERGRRKQRVVNEKDIE